MKKILVILFLIALSCPAQHFTNQAEIKSVATNTLYRINVHPTVRMNMSSDFRDTRIIDSRGKEIPFIVMNEAPLKSRTDFVSYPIVSQSVTELYSEIVVENTDKQKISNIAFNINNSDAHKYCSIEGSDDRKQWYSVSEKQVLSLAYSDHYTNTYKCIYFPLNDYKYFRLVIDNFSAQPFRINSAGYFKNSVSPGVLIPVVATTRIETNDRLKKTSIFVTLNSEQEISRLDFYVSSPRLFKRQATIYASEKTTAAHGADEILHPLHNFEIRTDRPLLYDLNFRAKDFVIEIDNKDNPALQIDSVIFKQLAAYLVCDLNTKEKYTLNWGNKKLPQPQYDLAEFVSTVPHLLPEALMGEVKAVSPPVVAPVKVDTLKKETPFLESKIFLWSCIGAGAVIILFFSLSLVKEMKSKEDKG